MGWWCRKCSRSREGEPILVLGDRFGAAVPKQTPRQMELAVEWEVEKRVAYLVELEWAMAKLGKISVEDHLSRRPSHPEQEH